MEKNYWKLATIAMGSILLVAMILFCIPGFVVLMTTPHIIAVDTESQWIGFWGNYLGALMGGVLSGLVAIFVMNGTLKSGKRERKQDEINNFVNWIIEQTSEIMECIESLIYCGTEYMAYDELSVELLQKLHEKKRKARVAVLSINSYMEIRKKDSIFQGENLEELCTLSDDLFDELVKYSLFVTKKGERNSEEIKNANKKIFDMTNNLCEKSLKYSKYLVEKKSSL